MNMLASRILSVLALLCLFAGAAIGQNSIVGRVFDDQNGNGTKQLYENFVPNRLVFLFALDREGNYGARTGKDGSFTIRDVPEGRYRLRVETEGQKVTYPKTGGWDITLPVEKPRPYVFGVHEPCLEVGKLTTSVQPTTNPNCFNWDVTFTNTSDEKVSDIYFDVTNPVLITPIGNPLSWNHYAFSNPVLPGASATMHLQICNVKAGECIDVPLFIVNTSGMCCLTTIKEVCFPEKQCVAITESVVKCGKNGTYNWGLTIQNLSGTTVLKVAIGGIRSSSGTLLGVANPSFYSGLSIPNNGYYSLPVMTLPAIPGGTVIIMDIVLFNSSGECCRYTIKFRLPFCSTDGHCDICADPLDKLARKPTFAHARTPVPNPAVPPTPARFWSNYKGTVAARTFSQIQYSPSRVNDDYALAFINMQPANIASPVLGQYTAGTLFDAQYHGPPDPNDATGTTDLWKHKYLGTVFGLTMDRMGNTYVAHFGMYPGNVQTGQDPYTGLPWKWGSILKIDNQTGEISKFAELPNDPVTNPGLGNLTFDFDHNLIFATNLEDGLIYRMSMAGNTSGVWPVGSYFGPFTTEKPGTLNGVVKSSARIFAIQYHCGRLYFSRFADTKYSWSVSNNPEENLIYSIPLDANGNFVPGIPKYEAGMTSLNSGISIHKNPVSDISFSPEGRMGVAEMTLEYNATPAGPFFQHYREGAHESQAWEYYCDEKTETWVASDRFHVGPWSADSAGGLDYDYNTSFNGKPYKPGVWWTGTNLNPSFYTGNVWVQTPINAQQAAYGTIGFDPINGGNSYYGPRTFADSAMTSHLYGNAIIIDYNGAGDPSWYSKRRFGDIEFPLNK